MFACAVATSASRAPPRRTARHIKSLPPELVRLYQRKARGTQHWTSSSPPAAAPSSPPPPSPPRGHRGSGLTQTEYEEVRARVEARLSRQLHQEEDSIIQASPAVKGHTRRRSSNCPPPLHLNSTSPPTSPSPPPSPEVLHKYGFPLVSAADFEAIVENEVIDADQVDSSWMERINHDGVMTWTREFGDTGNIQVRAGCVIKGWDPFIIFDLIYDMEMNVKWGVSWKEMTSVEHFEDGSECVYLVLNTPLGVSNRDFVQFRKSFQDRENGLYMIGFRHGEHPSRPPVSGIVRAETLGLSGYLIRQIDDGSNDGVIKVRLSLVTALDVKGYVPKRVVNWIAGRAPKDWRKNVQAACDKYGPTYHERGLVS